MTNVEVEKCTKMRQEWQLSTEYYLVVTLAAFEDDHLLVKWKLGVLRLHVVPHLHVVGVAENVDAKLRVQRVRVVRVGHAVLRECAVTQLWHELGLVVVDVLVCFEQEVVELVADVVALLRFSHLLEERVAVAELVLFVGLAFSHTWDEEFSLVLLFIALTFFRNVLLRLTGHLSLLEVRHLHVTDELSLQGG